MTNYKVAVLTNFQYNALLMYGSYLHIDVDVKIRFEKG